MTEKVKIPHEVAEAIEALKNAEYSNYGIVALLADKRTEGTFRNLSDHAAILHDWMHGEGGANADELLDALVNGYEVEQPPIKAGDWVARTQTRKIKKYQTDLQDVVFKVAVSDGQTVRGEDGNTHSVQGLRHATAEEKVWAELSRPIGDFRDKDALLIRDGSVYIVAMYMGCEKYNNMISPGFAEQFYNAGKVVRIYPSGSFVNFEGGASHA